MNFSNIKSDRGVTLIELLVSLAIGAVILGGCIVVYMDQLNSARRLSAYALLQDSGRVALDLLEQDIRMAGFTGCFSLNDELNNTLAGTLPASFQPAQGIQGWEAANTAPGDVIANVSSSTAVVSLSLTGDGAWATSGGNVLDALKVMPNSDIIRIWSAGDIDADVTAITAGTPNVLTVAANHGFADDSVLLLSDCERVDIVQACTIAGGNITLGSDCSPGNNNSISLQTNAAQAPSVTELQANVYLIGKLSDVSRNPPSLFRAQLNTNGVGVGALQEIVQGIESMQILYGENLDDDNLSSADTYVTADNVTDWQNVVSVRISLLLQSIDDNLAPGALPYVFNGVTYDGIGENPSPSDNRLRRVFTRTINLRNRTLGS